MSNKVVESSIKEAFVVKNDIFCMLVFFSPLASVKISEIKLYDKLPASGFIPKKNKELPSVLKDSLKRLASFEDETLSEDFFDLSNLSSSRLEVLRALRSKILRGKVISYSGLAALSGFSPGAARFAGTCMATNPFPLYYPCHRVVKSGGLTGNYGPGREMKVRILQREGVKFSSAGRIQADCIIS